MDVVGIGVRGCQQRIELGGIDPTRQGYNIQLHIVAGRLHQGSDAGRDQQRRQRLAQVG